MPNTKLLIILLLLFLIMLIATLALSTFKNSQTHTPARPPTSAQPNGLPLPTLAPVTQKLDQEQTPDQNQEFLSSSKRIASESAEFNGKMQAIAQLIKILPAGGQNFKLNFDFAANRFILNLDSQNKEAGQAEYNQFLIKHNVDGSLLKITVGYQ